MKPLSSEVQKFLVSLSRTLGVRIDRVLDLYFYVTPQTVRIIELVEQGGDIVGARLAVKSRRGDTWYYTSVGYYGAKCTCEGSVVGRKICRHMIIGVITWHMAALLKRGRGVDLEKLTWLRGAASDL